MKLKYLFLSLVFCVSCHQNKDGCPKGPVFGRYADNRLHINNNSSISIAYSMSYRYPDTTIEPLPINVLNANPSFEVQPGKDESIDNSRCWNGDLANGKKVIFFIFDSKIIRTIPLDTIVKKYQILKRYILTLEEIESLNWNIRYP